MIPVPDVLQALTEALAHIADGYRTAAIPSVEHGHLRADETTSRIIAANIYAQARGHLDKGTAALRRDPRPESRRRRAGIRSAHRPPPLTPRPVPYDRRSTSATPDTLPATSPEGSPAPPVDRIRMSGFATGLAARLPGGWISSDLDWSDQVERRRVTDFLWDHAAMDHVVFTYHLTRGALLTANDFTQLLVIDRPARPGQFFVGALTPLGIDITEREVPLTPHGIAVPCSPARAAHKVGSRLLPAYYAALGALVGQHPSPRYLTPANLFAGVPTPATTPAAAGARR